MKWTNKGKMLAAILAIAFVAYNVAFFAVFGFTGHGATFWLSYAFMVLAFACMVGAGCLLGSKGMFLRDWLFGYPIIKHTTVYIFAELIVSTLFAVFESHIRWGWALAAQILILCVYAIFAISCFLAKETIDDVRTKVSDKTRYIKLLRADTEILAEKCQDSDLKEQLLAFSEDVRNSDPMSNEALFELEKDLALTVSQCDHAITDQDYTTAAELLKKASLQLYERNKKCKALK